MKKIIASICFCFLLTSSAYASSSRGDLQTRIDAAKFRIILTQGLNRQIRRMCSALGYKARRLQRVRIMNVTLGDLPVGEWRDLTPDEIAGLMPTARQAART